MKPPIFGIDAVALPEDALLQVYRNRDGCYTDCYAADLPVEVTLAEFVAAFYTTALFKVERAILKLAFSKSSSDAEARDVGTGETDGFAAWNVEQRCEHQLLMCDLSGRTRSWFMTEPNNSGTRLYFGSAVVPIRNRTGGRRSIGPMYAALLGFHKLYSRALLYAAKSRLTGRWFQKNGP